MSEKKLTAEYTLIQSFFWMGYAVILGFVSLYLLDRGFTNGQAGTVIAVGGLLSALFQPAVAGLADREDGPSAKKLTLILTVTLTALGGALLAVPGSRVLTCLFYGAAIMLLQMGTSLINALGVTGEQKPNYGIARGLASVFYAAIAFGLGYFADWFGSWVVPGGMVLAFGLLTAMVLRYPFHRENDSRKAAAAGTPLQFFRKYPRFALILVGCILLFISHALLNSFTFQIAVAKGGGSSEMGTAMALAAIIEIPTMLLFSRMLKFARCDTWFSLCGIFFFLKTLGTLLCGSVAGFYAVQLFQLLGWGLIAVSSVYYIHSIMDASDAVKGQAYYTVSMTLGNVLGAVAGGRILDALGVDAMLVFGCVCALVGAGILLLFARNRKGQA